MFPRLDVAAKWQKEGVQMPKSVQLRNIPDVLPKVLESRAAVAGKSLSDYLVAELRGCTEYPTAEELRRRLRSRTPVRPTRSIGQGELVKFAPAFSADGFGFAVTSRRA